MNLWNFEGKLFEKFVSAFANTKPRQDISICWWLTLIAHSRISFLRNFFLNAFLKTFLCTPESSSSSTRHNSLHIFKKFPPRKFNINIIVESFLQYHLSPSPLPQWLYRRFMNINLPPNFVNFSSFTVLCRECNKDCSPNNRIRPLNPSYFSTLYEVFPPFLEIPPSVAGEDVRGFRRGRSRGRAALS